MAKRNFVEHMSVNPDPRFVWLIDYAIDAVSSEIHDRKPYAAWFAWAADWRAGKRSPQACVDASHACRDIDDFGVSGSLAQIAWGAKEACYSAPKSGWLALRYVADAMIAFGVAFPAASPIADNAARAICAAPDPDA